MKRSASNLKLGLSDVPETLGVKLDDLKIIGIPCNVTSEEEVVAAYDKTLQTFGHIDVVVASAGEYPPRFSSLEVMDRTLILATPSL